MKLTRQTLIKRMQKRFLIYTTAFATLFCIIFFASGNELPENADVFAVVVLGIPLFLGVVISIFGLAWEFAYGDHDPRVSKKSVN